MNDLERFFLESHLRLGVVTSAAWNSLSDEGKLRQLTLWESEFHTDNHHIYLLMKRGEHDSGSGT